MYYARKNLGNDTGWDEPPAAGGGWAGGGPVPPVKQPVQPPVNPPPAGGGGGGGVVVGPTYGGQCVAFAWSRDASGNRYNISVAMPGGATRTFATENDFQAACYGGGSGGGVGSGQRVAPYTGQVLQYSADTGWNPAGAAAAEAQLEIYRRSLTQPAQPPLPPLVTDTFGAPQLPPAPGTPAAMQLEEFQTQPQPAQAPLMAVAAPAPQTKQAVPLLAILAAGAMAYFWMRQHA